MGLTSQNQARCNIGRQATSLWPSYQSAAPGEKSAVYNCLVLYVICRELTESVPRGRFTIAVIFV